MKKIYFIGILCMFAYAGFSQISPEKVVEEFWNNYETKTASEALDQLYKGSPWIERAKSDIEDLKTKFEGLPNIVGKYHGREMLVKKTLANCYVSFVYMVKYDRQPMRVQFNFYKPDREWKLHGFIYDFDMTSEFEEYVKQESIK
jgi:hypothetical protein